MTESQNSLPEPLLSKFISRKLLVYLIAMAVSTIEALKGVSEAVIMAQLGFASVIVGGQSAIDFIKSKIQARKG